MKHHLIICCCILLVSSSLLHAQRFAEESWSATFSNYVHSDIKSVLKTNDNNFMVVGTTQSMAMKGPDIWIGKISDKPRLQWHKTFRDDNDFVVNKIVQTTDGQYAILVSVYSEQKTNCRSYVFKVDQSGRLLWDKHYTTYAWEEAVDIVATTDGGFLMAGHIKSNPRSPFYYAWVAKLDNKGLEQWNNVFDLFDMASFESIVEVKDGFVLQGNVTVQNKPDNIDAWLVKINHIGDAIWEKTYGDYGKDEAYKLIHTKDGGYAFCGYTNSTGQGEKDAWLVKTDGRGELQWEQTYGTYMSEHAHSVVQMSDNSFVFTGTAKSYINNSFDAWMVWTDEEGEKLGEQFHGGKGNDEAYDLLASGVDEIVVVGYSTSKTNNYYHEPFIANYKMRFEVELDKENLGLEKLLVSSSTSAAAAAAAPNPFSAAASSLPTPTTSMLTFKVPDLHILSIGTNPPDLEYTEKDAIDFANSFKNQGNQLGSGNKLFNMVQAEKLTGHRANIKNVESAIEALHRKAAEGHIKPNDVLMVFISAHGFLYQNKLRIQASDYDYRSPRTTSLDYDELLKDLDLLDCKKILFIDACHSASPSANYAAKASVRVVNDAIHKISMTKRGLAVITSSDVEEQSYEDRKAKNGFFTKALLEGFKGFADYDKNNIVSLTELFEFVERRVPAMVGIHTKQRQNPQMVRNDLGDLPIYVVK